MTVDVQASVPMMDEVGIYAEGLRSGKYHKLLGVRKLYFAGFDGIMELTPEYGKDNDLLGFRVKPYQGVINSSTLQSSSRTLEVAVGNQADAYRWMNRR